MLDDIIFNKLWPVLEKVGWGAAATEAILIWWLLKQLERYDGRLVDLQARFDAAQMQRVHDAQQQQRVVEQNSATQIQIIDSLLKRGSDPL